MGDECEFQVVVFACCCLNGIRTRVTITRRKKTVSFCSCNRFYIRSIVFIYLDL